MKNKILAIVLAIVVIVAAIIIFEINNHQNDDVLQDNVEVEFYDSFDDGDINDEENNVFESTLDVDEPTDKIEPDEETLKAEVLAKAQNYSDTLYMSKSLLLNQLTNPEFDGYSKALAEYAVENINVDYNENAKNKAILYRDEMSMSEEEIKNQLSSKYGDGFTDKEVAYAIEHYND